MDLENIVRRTLASVKRAGCVSVHGLRVACRAGMCVCVCVWHALTNVSLVHTALGRMSHPKALSASS